MIRNYTLILCSFFLSSAAAQNWCPPGAEWTYGFSSQAASGITRAWYSDDTLVGGFIAQRIDQTIHAYQPWPPFGQEFTQELEPLFTRFEDGVVFIWDHWSSTFDTLLWFDAVPGQHWKFHHQDDLTRFDVLDTGTTMVQGIPLRYLVVEEPFILYETDTIRERIGSGYFYIDPMETLLIDWTTFGLKCYRDDVIENFHGWLWSWTPECDFTVHVENHQEWLDLLHPNPGINQFTLQLPPGDHQLKIFDQLGRSVIQIDRISDQAVIGTASLPPGIYTLLIIDRNGRAFHQLWIKE